MLERKIILKETLFEALTQLFFKVKCHLGDKKSSKSVAYNFE